MIAVKRVGCRDIDSVDRGVFCEFRIVPISCCNFVFISESVGPLEGTGRHSRNLHILKHTNSFCELVSDKTGTNNSPSKGCSHNHGPSWECQSVSRSNSVLRNPSPPALAPVARMTLSV